MPGAHLRLLPHLKGKLIHLRRWGQGKDLYLPIILRGKDNKRMIAFDSNPEQHIGYHWWLPLVTLSSQPVVRQCDKTGETRWRSIRLLTHLLHC